MVSRHVKLGWLGLVASLAAVSPALAQRAAPLPSNVQTESASSHVCRVALEDLPPGEREHVQLVLDRPTLTARGPTEVFTCRSEHYYWLLDHPDQTVRLWRLMGIKCADIVDRGGYFTWDDGKGSGIRWHEVYRGPDRRVWYAEGKVNPGFLLPPASIQAVVVIFHCEGTDAAGRPAMRQHLEMALHTDSHLLAAAAKLLGASVPHLAQQYVGQIQMFYGALAWYLNQHPRHTEVLFDQLKQPVSTDRALTLPTE